MKVAFLHTRNFFTSELLQKLRATLAHHEVVEWVGGKDAPAFDFDVLLAMGSVGRGLLSCRVRGSTSAQRRKTSWRGLEIHSGRPRQAAHA